MLVDATVAEQAIRYPTDLSLLNEAREISEQLIDELYKQSGYTQKPRTYRRLARKNYLNLAKKKKPGRKILRQGLRQQLQYIRRNSRYIDELLDDVGSAPFPLPHRQQRQYWIIQHVYRQQDEMYRNRKQRCDDRIVSIAQPHVRPIVRGKAGKKVEFKVEVKEVKVRLMPELDDEFAKDIDEKYETLDALRTAVFTELKEEKEAALEGDLNDRIMQKLLESHSFDVPERLVRFEVEEMIKQTESNLERSGLTLESAGISRDDLAKNNRETAVKRVKGDFILKKIAEVEDIKLADEDIERGYQRIADEYNMSVAEVKGFFQRREEVLPFVNELLNEKILRFLRESANLVDEKPQADTEEKATEEE